MPPSNELLREIPFKIYRFLRRKLYQVLCRIKPIRQPYHRLFKMTLRQWLLYHQRLVDDRKCRWMGVRAGKNPLDAWIYQEIIHDIKPDIVVEIGCAEGGSTLYLAHLLDAVGKGSVISIDIDRSNFHAEHDRIIPITGNSSDPETVAKVSELCRGKNALVIHDGDHTRDQVLRDLRAYEGFVGVGSYFIVEDGIIDLFVPGDGIRQCFHHGPLEAVEAFLKENASFTVDTELERYILTYNPKGFLKRVR